MAKSYRNFELQHGRKEKVKLTIFTCEKMEAVVGPEEVLPCLLHLIPNQRQAFNRTVGKAKEVVICKDTLSTKLLTLM